MPDPLQNTFRTLTTTANPFAGELLVAALDVPELGIQREAVNSLAKRGGVREQMEAIRRYPKLPVEIQSLLEDAAPALVPALRQCCLLGRGDFEIAALELTSAGEAFGMVETLLEILQSQRTELHKEAVIAFRHLVNRLYEQLHGHQSAEARVLKNPSQIQHLMLMALDQSLSSFQELAFPEDVVEAILALGGPGHFATNKVLNQASVECRSLAKHLLNVSRHPGVMQMLLDSLGKPHPSARVLEAIQNRSDMEFCLATLRWVPKRWTNTQERNLKQLERLAWLEEGEDALELIPEEMHFALMEFVSAAGFDRNQKLEIRQWIVRHGSPAARNAAVEVLGDLDSHFVKEIVLDGLESEDPSVQAWATSQLREQHVPDALGKLIDRLDSPEICVQTVARQELQGFNLECLLEKFDSLSPDACQNAARLLEKIDPDYLAKLHQELHHSIRRRRIRAIRAALAYGWHEKSAAVLRKLLKDEDNLIRRTAVEVLAHIPTAETRMALKALENDPSQRVRETVEQALAQLGVTQASVGL